MALSLQFRISLSSDGEILTIKDTTGAYSGITSGGFGSPNPEISDATTATIKIAKRNSDGTFSTDVTIDAYSTLPSNSAGTFDIDATDGVDSATYPDGIYRIVYTVTGTSSGTPFSATVTRYDVLRNSIANCYQQKAAQYAACNCNCEDIAEDLKCMSLLMSLLCREEGGCSECSGNLNQIQLYLDKLTSICSETGCGC